MNQGYIRNTSDMKFLILFILDTFSEPINGEILLQSVLSDPCADYFTYSDALSGLCTDGFVAEDQDGYRITESGKKNFAALGQVLPYSVRRNAQNAATKALASAQRQSCIRTSTVKCPDSNLFTTTLSMSDGKDTIVSLSLLTVKSEQGAEIERNFSRHAEKIYMKILSALTEEYPEDSEVQK